MGLPVPFLSPEWQLGLGHMIMLIRGEQILSEIKRKKNPVSIMQLLAVT